MAIGYIVTDEKGNVNLGRIFTNSGAQVEKPNSYDDTFIDQWISGYTHAGRAYGFVIREAYRNAQGEKFRMSYLDEKDGNKNWIEIDQDEIPVAKINESASDAYRAREARLNHLRRPTGSPPDWYIPLPVAEISAKSPASAGTLLRSKNLTVPKAELSGGSGSDLSGKPPTIGSAQRREIKKGLEDSEYPKNTEELRYRADVRSLWGTLENEAFIEGVPTEISSKLMLKGDPPASINIVEVILADHDILSPENPLRERLSDLPGKIWSQAEMDDIRRTKKHRPIDIWSGIDSFKVQFKCDNLLHLELDERMQFTQMKKESDIDTAVVLYGDEPLFSEIAELDPAAKLKEDMHSHPSAYALTKLQGRRAGKQRDMTTASQAGPSDATADRPIENIDEGLTATPLFNGQELGDNRFPTGEKAIDDKSFPIDKRQTFFEDASKRLRPATYEVLINGSPLQNYFSKRADGRSGARTWFTGTAGHESPLSTLKAPVVTPEKILVGGMEKPKPRDIGRSASHSPRS